MGIIVHYREEKRLVVERNKKTQYIEVKCDCCGETIPHGESYYSVSCTDGDSPCYRTDGIYCRFCTNDILYKQCGADFKHLEIKRHRNEGVLKPYMEGVTYICDESDWCKEMKVSG